MHTAYLSWKITSFSTRASLLRNAAKLLRERKKDYATLMANEMGKPITQGAGEIEKCAWVCEYYAEHGEQFLASETIQTENRESFVTFQPLGVILAVMPWNFPFWQVFRFAAPTLMAGNAALLKHASNVPGCSRAIEQLFKDAGFPENIFKSLFVKGSEMEPVIADPLVKAVTLTGSTEAGRSVAATAGKYLKKTVLELGGSDPYIILKDADLALAAKQCVQSRLINSGQSCIAAKRFIVEAPVHDAFVELVRTEMAAYIMGDPHDPATQIGTQASHRLRDQLHKQVTDSITKGANLLLGGTIPDDPRPFYPATLLTGVHKGMPAFDEELFGPVASIIKAENEQEALALANDSPFGLGSAIFTQDIAKAKQFATSAIEAGACFINDFVKSDPRLPFGGINESGYGRELGLWGIREFVNVKTVVVA
jgi:succinate-semialdehyde dehydrogenase/glutarate-semialdehyde dehydrogenase